MIESPSEAAGPGIYLYCVARPECTPVVDALAQHDLPGVDERFPVTGLEAAGMVAVISEVDTGEFSDQNLQALPWVGPRALRHAAVVEHIMSTSPVLPVKFGTIFRTRDSLTDFLVRHRDDFVRALQDLRDKSEWGVKGYLVDEDARRLVSVSDPAIQSRTAALPSSPGARYLQQKQLDGMIDAALRVWLERVTRDLQENLALHAVAATELRCRPGSVIGRSERMVLNCSYLLTPAILPDFRAALSKQQHAYDGTGLTLELRGPWPPYNFCPAFPEGQT